MSAVDTMCQVDAGFAINAGKLEGRLPPGRATFPLERLEALSQLTAEDPVIARAYKLESFAQVELAERMHDPDVLSPLGRWVLTLLLAPFEREADRNASLRKLLVQVPFYIAEAITTQGPVGALQLEVASEVAEGFPRLLDALSQRAPRDLADVCVNARASMTDFQRALRRAHVLERKPILGRDRLAELLALKGIAYDVQELEALGEERFRKAKERRTEAIRHLTGFSDLKGALRALDSDMPDAPLKELSVLCRQARNFVGEHGLFPVPSDEELDVIETPAFAQPRVAAITIITAKPLWPVQRSLLCVTRPMNRSALKTTVVHYGYPGRHLRAVLANSTAKLVTNVTWTTSAYATLDSEIADAWPDEQQALMQRKGFHSSPADHVQLTHTATSRALDLLLHLRLHTARITPVTAAQLLVDEAGLPPAAAYTQVRHALLTPLGTP